MAETVAEYEADGFHETQQAKVRPLDWDEIIADCDKALALDASDVNALIRRGDAFLNRNDNQSAIKDYTAAIDMVPDNAEAYHGRGGVHVNLRDYNSAIADYGAALRCDPYDGISIVALESTYVALWEQKQTG